MTAKQRQQDTEWYKFTQPNPTEKKRSRKGDCVVRALANATRKTWMEAYEILDENAKQTYNVPNDPINYGQVFDRMGFITRSCQPEPGGTRMTAKQFAQEHKQGRYILRLSNHLAAVVDGVILDTWNCQDKCVYKYWEVML